jgi:glutathione S-transferase
LADEFGLDESQRLKWIRHWIQAGLRAVEKHLAKERETGLYCHGDRVTIADVCLVSLAVGNSLFQGELREFPTAARIVERCMAEDAFASAHPLRQPGAPAAT